jgi:hypothetical protein
LRPHAAALGDRVLQPGKERTTIAGDLVTDVGERHKVRVILQLPSKVRIEGLRRNGGSVFDGTSSRGTPSRIEEQLLEIFSSDTAEAMMASSRDGAAVQLLGRRVRSTPDGSGPLYDIYEWAGPVGSSPSAVERLKRYAFDSETGLLAYTQYLDESFSPPLSVQIRFSDWRKIEASAYPGRIDRIENGHLTFSWTAAEIVASAVQDPGTFNELLESGK